MSARDAATAIAEKKISSVELVEECLKRIDSREEVVGAWAYIDRDLAIKEASLRDSQHVQGPLHGVPIGIKDVIDTIDLPTEYGSTIYAGHRPRREASCVSLVRRAGGVILGKTVTTEFALYQPGKTTNPHNPAHTPGALQVAQQQRWQISMSPLPWVRRRQVRLFVQHPIVGWSDTNRPSTHLRLKGQSL